MNSKEIGRRLNEVIRRRLSRETEEDHEKLQDTR
jgi:hypothetical protein